MNQYQPQYVSPVSGDRLYTRPETKATLGIGDSKYWQLIRDGKLEVVRLGRRTTRVKGSSIVALMAGEVA